MLLGNESFGVIATQLKNPEWMSMLIFHSLGQTRQKVIWAKSRRAGPLGCEALCVCFDVEPASPNTSSAKWTYGDADAGSPGGTHCSLVGRLKSSVNNNCSWWLLRFWWACAALGQMCHYSCSIKRGTNKQILVHGKFWNSDSSLKQEVQNSGWLQLLKLSWCLGVPAELQCFLSDISAGHSHEDVRKGSQPSCVFPALGVAVGQADEEWGHHAQNSQGQHSGRRFLPYLTSA